MTATDFAPNAKVRHPGKPEWGVGTVLTVQKASHEGKPCHRLTVRFDGAGKKMINTAFAKLITLDEGVAKAERPKPADRPAPKPAAGPGPAAPRPPAPAEQAAEPEPEKRVLAERLATLAETLVDPFRSLEARLGETLERYRVENDGASLLQWASLQTGQPDPLSFFSRQELEEHFKNHRIRLDRHLKGLLDEARRGKVDVRPIIASAPPGAQHALRRINPGR